MDKSLKLNTQQASPIVQATFPDYKGRKFSLEFTEKVWLHDLAWDGGSKNFYAGIKVDGTVRHLKISNPWTCGGLEGKDIPLTPDAILVEHCYFCGHDLGIRIYAHPSLAPKLLGQGE